MMRGTTVAGGKRGDATWNAFAEMPCQVEGRERHLEHFRGDSMPGGRQGDATWNAFAEIPCQVGGRKGHLEHFRRNSVAGGQQEKTPGTLSQEFRGRVRKDLCFDFHSQDGKRIALIIGAVTAECSESHPLVEFHS